MLARPPRVMFYVLVSTDVLYTDCNNLSEQQVLPSQLLVLILDLDLDLVLTNLNNRHKFCKMQNLPN